MARIRKGDMVEVIAGNDKGAHGRVRREMPVHMSNIMLYDESAGARTRIGFQGEGTKKVRVSRKTGAEIGTVAAEPKKAKKKAKKKAAKKKASKKAEGKES